MMRYANILFVLQLMIVPLFFSCIEEDDSNCVQYSVSVSKTDSAGRAVPSAVKGNMRAYLFVNNHFERIVTADADGSYKLSFDVNVGSVSLVTIGLSAADSAVVYTPVEGDDIGEMSVSVKEDSAAGGYTLPSSLYYGRYSYHSGKGGGLTQDTTIVALNKPATLHVVVRQLKEFYGEGTYRIVISGFRKSMTFSGTITGDSIRYTPACSFDTRSQLVTDPIRVLPNKTGEYVKVSIYRNATRAEASSLVWESNKDQNGNRVAMGAGEDKVIIMDCSRRDINMIVMPWADYAQTVVY